MTAVKTEIGAETPAQRAPHAPTSNIPKSSVWDAIEYVRSTLNSAISAVASSLSSLTAADVAFVATGNIAATDVQAALEELDSEKAATADLGTMSTQDADAVAITGGTIDGAALTTVPSPSNGGDAANKTYVDGAVATGARRSTVRVVDAVGGSPTTDYEAGDTVDSVTLVAGDLVLRAAAGSPASNGVYVVPASGAAARSSEFDTYNEHPGTLIIVQEGTTYADTLWLCTSNKGGTLNSTSIVFSQFSVTGIAEVLADTSPQLGGALDANGFNIGFDNSTGITDDSNNETLLFGKTASAVNYLKATNAATTNGPTLAALGDDTNIDLNWSSKGTGLVKANAQPVLTGGVHEIPISASQMVSRTTNGAAVGTVEMSTNKNMFRTLDFDTTTQEFAQFTVPRMPKGWNRGTITFIPIWSHAFTTTNFGVVWALQAVAISDDDAGDVAFGTEQTSTDTGGTTNDIYHGPASSAITVAGSPAAGDTVMFQVKRNPSDGSDTMAIDARLHGILLRITLDAPNDA